MKNNYQRISIILFILTTGFLLFSYLIKISGMTIIGIGLIGYLLTTIFFLLSKENKKINKILIFSFLTLILLSFIFGIVDYHQIKSNKNPIFSILVFKYKDGGSKEYFGLGYKIIKCHNLNGDNSSNMGLYNLNINTACINSSDIYSLYIKVIDNILKSRGYSKSEYLALDLDSFELLDKNYKELLIEYIKKYNDNAFKSNYEELVENGYADESGWNLKGHLISIENFKKTNNTITFEIGRYKESLGAVGHCYKSTYKNNEWKIKKTCNWVS